MKKGVKILIITIGVIILLGLIFFCIDYIRVQKQEKPIFCINYATANDGGTKEYIGLGYKVIDFHKIQEIDENGNTSYYDEIKIGTWFMNYNDFANEYNKKENNISAQIKAVVVKANENSLLVMGIGETSSLYSVGFTSEGNIRFKQGQEILIHFNGTIMQTYPAQLGDVRKIEIIKEKSDVEIPQNILRYCYSSKDNVTVKINKLTKNSISYTINDTNELPYNYSNKYQILKKVKNENYTGVGQVIGENTKNSTAGFTRNRNGIYLERNTKNFKYI